MNLPRTALLSLLLLLILLVPSRAQDLFAKATEAYAAGDYNLARKTFAEIAARQPTANVFYNLGNACFRAGAPGDAALSYERTLRLAPWHGEATVNLNFVRQQTGARIVEARWPARIIGAVPRTLGPWIAVGLAWLGCLVTGIAVWRRNRGWIAGLIVLALAAAWGGAWLWWEKELFQTAIVIVERTEARREPAATGQTTEALNAGSRVRVLSDLSGWFYCELPTGAHGWVSEKDVESLAGGKNRNKTVML